MWVASSSTPPLFGGRPTHCDNYISPSQCDCCSWEELLMSFRSIPCSECWCCVPIVRDAIHSTHWLGGPPQKGSRVKGWVSGSHKTKWTLFVVLEEGARIIMMAFYRNLVILCDKTLNSLSTVVCFLTHPHTLPV